MTDLIAEANVTFPPGTFNIIPGSPDPFFVEFLNPTVSKGATLVEMCARFNVPLSEVVAFGDGDNDKEMLLCAGLGVAMKNARPAAKEAADVINEVKHLNILTLQYRCFLVVAKAVIVGILLLKTPFSLKNNTVDER